MDDYEEELSRWIRRAETHREQLHAGSEQERQLSQAIRGMELEQLAHQIQRTRKRLGELPAGSAERRKLAQALGQMAKEYLAGREEIRGPSPEVRAPESAGAGAGESAGAGPPTAEARVALQRASAYLLHPAPDAGLREAIAEIEQALARLKEVRRR